jgi:hypothetical protein
MIIARPVDMSTVRVLSLPPRAQVGRGRPVNPMSVRQKQIAKESKQLGAGARVEDTQVIKYMSFAEIIQGRDSIVRMTEDGLIYAVDLVMAMTGLNRNVSGMTLRRLRDNVFPPCKMSSRQLSIRFTPQNNYVCA